MTTRHITNWNCSSYNRTVVVTSQFSEEVKNKQKSELDVTVVDSILGVSVFPDDGHHCEFVISGNTDVRPNDPDYLIDVLKKLWALDISLDKQSEDALHILCLATQETSGKAAFLTTYLALEELIERHPRSDAAVKVLQKFKTEIIEFGADKEHPLLPEEANSLVGVFRSLNEESFTSALNRLGKQIREPAKLCGMSVPDFLSACINARNKIAHHAMPETNIPLGELSKSLREFALMLIWTRNKLPSFTLNTPPSAVSIPPGGFSIRIM